MNDSIRVIGQFLWLEAIHVQKFARNPKQVGNNITTEANYSRTSINSHVSTMPTICGGSPYIESCLNLSTMATIFCPQGGHCVEVQK